MGLLNTGLFHSHLFEALSVERKKSPTADRKLQSSDDLKSTSQCLRTAIWLTKAVQALLWRNTSLWRTHPHTKAISRTKQLQLIFHPTDFLTRFFETTTSTYPMSKTQVLKSLTLLHTMHVLGKFQRKCYRTIILTLCKKPKYHCGEKLLINIFQQASSLEPFTNQSFCCTPKPFSSQAFFGNRNQMELLLERYPRFCYDLTAIINS